MTENNYRALVVDDEPAVRNLAIRALQREGFTCDAAGDGLEAEERVSAARYDVVVTDLRMPNKNGHAFASNILLRQYRPVVVILTGVLEPKIARDMTLRGVDCIEFKPVNYPLFAAKVRGLVEGRKLHAGGEPAESPAVAPMPKAPRPAVHAGSIEMIGKHDIEGKLTQLTRILPISGTAFDIFNMTSAETYDNFEIAAAVRRDATLSVDILRLANSSYYNYSSKKVINLVKAIGRIGQKRVGELALATSMMVSLTPSVLPWMDLGLTWHRSMAAATATDLLSERKSIPQKDNRLFLSSIVYPLGRVALSMLYPNRYQQMIRVCQDGRLSLREQERLHFAMSPEEAMSYLLKAWNLPAVLYEPLEYCAQSYGAIASLAEPLAGRVDLLKVAILIAEIAVGRWESWDRIETPPARLLDRLGVEGYGELIAATKRDYKDLVRFRSNIFQHEEADGNYAPTPPTVPAYYCNLASDSFDFLAQILLRSGIALRECDPRELDPREPLIVNCIGVPAHRLLASLNPDGRENMLLVSIASQTENFGRFGRVISLPASHDALESACRELVG